MKIPIEHICALVKGRLEDPREKLTGAPLESGTAQFAIQTDCGLPFPVPLIGPRPARAGVARARSNAITIMFFIYNFN